MSAALLATTALTSSGGNSRTGDAVVPTCGSCPSHLHTTELQRRALLGQGTRGSHREYVFSQLVLLLIRHVELELAVLVLVHRTRRPLLRHVHVVPCRRVGRGTDAACLCRRL